VLDLSDVARRCFPTYALDDDQARAVGHGRRLDADLGAPGPVAVLDPAGTFLALYEQRGSLAAPVAVFT
jgi:tRNA pseudouridine55 synthase